MPTPTPYIVYGTVTLNSVVQAGVTVTLENLTHPASDTRVTEADGTYIFDDVPSGYAIGDEIQISVTDYSDSFIVPFFDDTNPLEPQLLDLDYYALVIQDSTHSHTSDNLDLTQVHILVIQDAEHAQTSDNLALTQVHILTVDDSTHAITSENVVLTQIHVLTIADSTHSQTADNTVLTQIHILTIADSEHAQTADNAILTQVHILTIADSTHAQTSDNLVLTVEGEVIIQDSTHSQTSDNLTLTQVHILLVSDSTHVHTSDNLIVLTEEETPFVIQDSTHSHTSDNLALTQIHILVIADSTHAHTSDAISLNLAVSSIFSVFDNEETITHIDLISIGYTDTSGNWVPETSTDITIMGHVSDLSLEELRFINPALITMGLRKIAVLNSVGLVIGDRIRVTEMDGTTQTNWEIYQKQYVPGIIYSYLNTNRETFMMRRLI